MSFFVTKHFFIRIGMTLCLVFSSAALFAAHPVYAADEKPVIKRIAPSLKKLSKNFTPDTTAEAEVILRKTNITIDENLMSHATSYVAVYINSDAAVRDYSQISVSFNSFYEDIALEFAQVRTPDGHLDSIKSDATQIQSPSDENFYQDRKELLFSLPNVRKGSIIEFQYRYTDTKKIIPRQWFDSFSFHWWEGRAASQGSRADKVINSEIQITAPAAITFFNNDTGKFFITEQHRTKGKTHIINWSGKNIPAIELQSSMTRSHDYAPYLRIGTMRSWSDIAHWANQLIAPHLLTDTAIDNLLADIKKTALTPEEKTKAVYRVIQDRVRYVFAHVGRGGYEPHDATDVLINGYGDCKDQTILAVTLLRKLGIEANPALIITRSRGIPDMSIPAVSFDHMIVHIPAQNGLAEIWMDTTGETSLYPGFSVGIEGQPALIVNDKTTDVTFLPKLAATEHYVDLELVFDKFTGKKPEARFTFTFGGLYEERLRSMWQYSHERDKYFRELVGQLYSVAEVTELSGNNADNLWQGFTLTGRFTFNNVWGGGQEPINYGFNITQLTNMFADLRNLHKPADRKQAFVTDPGYYLRTRIVFASPSKEHQLLVQTQGVPLDNAYYSLQQKGTAKKRRYSIEQQLLIKPAVISLDHYADFYQKTEDLLATPAWSVIYDYNKSAAELATLEKSGKSDVTNLLSIARHHIKNGNYAKALITAQDAVKVAPKIAEAWYVLGLAQGYNNLLPESDASFKKAEALGYTL